MNYIFDNKVVVTKSKKDYKTVDWGPYQFPKIYNANGILYLDCHMHKDSALSYGCETAKFISHDMGETWEKTTLKGGVLMNNQQMITPVRKKSVSADSLTLPKPIYNTIVYNQKRNIYDEKEFPEYLCKWYADIGPSGKLEETEISVTHNLFCRYTTEGVLPTNYFLRFYVDLEGNVWALQQRFLADAPRNNHALFYKSTDNGKSFTHFSTIYYDNKLNDYHKNADRLGFGEQSLTFTDKTHAFSLLRTTDGYKKSPLYISYSEDKAKSWSTPVIFDDLGVWPDVVSLKNGAHIAGYGRPGLFIRGLYNSIWDEQRTPVVEPLEYQTDTCSYCSMAAVSDDTFIIAYSDFQHIDENGNSVKAIITRKIKVEI